MHQAYCMSVHTYIDNYFCVQQCLLTDTATRARMISKRLKTWKQVQMKTQMRLRSGVNFCMSLIRRSVNHISFVARYGAL